MLAGVRASYAHRTGTREHRLAMAKATGFTSMSDEYARLGVDKYYELHARDYRNVHYSEIVHAVDDMMSSMQQAGMVEDELSILDLACGSGEATMAVQAWQASHAGTAPGTIQIHGADPYTSPAYHERTGRVAETYSFEDVAAGCLEEAQREYNLCICSFALHLLHEKSRLWWTLNALAVSCQRLAILSPHKKPSVAANTGWELEREVVIERVRVRLFRSTIFWQHHHIRRACSSTT